MDAGTRESELARTRALLHVVAAYWKVAKSPDQRLVAMSRINSLLDRYHRLVNPPRP